MAATDFSAAAIPTCQNLGMAARALLGTAAQQHHAGTGGQQQDRGHGERHRRGTRLAQAARLGGIHLAVRARLDRRLLRAGLLAIKTFTRAFRAACSAASASATWAGVASSSAATFFAASKAASNSSEPDLQSGSASLPASAITSFRAVLSANLTVTSKDFAKSVPLSATVTVTLPAAANGFAGSTGLPARRVFMAWLVHEVSMFSRCYRRCEMKVGGVL